MTKEKSNIKKDSFSKITLCQFLIMTFLLFAIFFLGSDDVKRDYKELMSYSITKDDFTAIASSVRDYFMKEPEIKDVFSESISHTETTATEPETTAEEAVTTTEPKKTESASGGEDIDTMEAPSDYSLKAASLESEIIMPVQSFRFTSYFGERINPITQKKGFHTGVDMAADKGTKIRAVLDGKVTKTGEDERAGKYICLSHGNGLTTLYCHCSEILQKKGSVVRQGETIALVGSTGMSTGPHLHFEISENGVKKDPYPLLSNAS